MQSPYSAGLGHPAYSVWLSLSAPGRVSGDGPVEYREGVKSFYRGLVHTIPTQVVDPSPPPLDREKMVAKRMWVLMVRRYSADVGTSTGRC